MSIQRHARSLIAAAGLAVVSLGVAGLPVSAQEKTVEVGGAPMYPSKTIVENADRKSVV